MVTGFSQILFHLVRGLEWLNEMGLALLCNEIAVRDSYLEPCCSAERTSLRKGQPMFDMKNLTKLKKLDEKAPGPMKAFWAFDKEAFSAGALDILQKQLMAVAVALTTQCPYCIELHVKAAREAGATDEMLAEVATVAAAMRAGAAITHATHLFKTS